MSNLYRFGVSLDKKLITEFDRQIKLDNYKNRSEAIRDLIRNELVREQWRGGDVVAGAITIIYDHHKRELVNKLLDLQHDFFSIIISTQHIHLSHDNCMEIIAVKGNAHDVIELANRLKATKGAFHVSLSMSTTGENLH